MARSICSGGYVTYALAVNSESVHGSLLLSVTVFGLFGVFLEKFCFRPFVGNFDASVIVCVGITVASRISSTTWWETK